MAGSSAASEPWAIGVVSTRAAGVTTSETGTSGAAGPSPETAADGYPVAARNEAASSDTAVDRRLRGTMVLLHRGFARPCTGLSINLFRLGQGVSLAGHEKGRGHQ